MTASKERIAAILAKHKAKNPSNKPVKQSRAEVKVDNILDELSYPALDSNSADVSTSFLDTPTDHSIPINLVTLAEGEIDPRLKLMSHSSRTTMHKCPRKNQLYRLGSSKIALADEKETEQGVTFAYGHAVGTGVAAALEYTTNPDKVIIETFLAWDTDLLEATPRQNKSYWLAQFAVEKFMNLLECGFLDDYELVYYQGKPAIELSFCIKMPDGFYYRGFVDAVLKHKVTGEIMVLENKTSSGTANSAMYKNSGQAVGYSVVLDIIFPELSSYLVLYLVYETKSYDYVELPFRKSLLQRALWLQELLIDVERIKLYESFNTHPMHGEACFDFFRECEYLSLCTMSTENLSRNAPLTQEIVDKIDRELANYQFHVDFYDLVESQIDKGNS